MGGWVHDGAGSLHHDGNIDIGIGKRGEGTCRPSESKKIPKLTVTATCPLTDFCVPGQL